MKLPQFIQNIWKAWITSVIGMLIPIATGVVTDIVKHTVDWQAVELSLVPAFVLLLTDIEKELKKAFGVPDTKQDDTKQQ